LVLIVGARVFDDLGLFAALVVSSDGGGGFASVVSPGEAETVGRLGCRGMYPRPVFA
jgi:hypothetical protein